jgi:uncharacterized protein (TIGR02246 family)
MKPHLPLLAMAVLVVACGGEGAEQAAGDAAMEAAPTAAGDEAAIDALRSSFVEHYNLHHASVVADLYADSAVFLAADGSVQEGKAAILAALEQQMAGSPTIELNATDRMTFGDHAAVLGTYTVNSTPEGAAPMALGGHYMSHFVRTDAGWKINTVVTNYNAPPPANLPAATSMTEAPPDNGTLKDLVGAWTAHFNAGHADSLAALYTADAKASFSDRGMAEGQSAIAAALSENQTPGASITIHDVATMDLGNGYALDGGWYEISAGGAVQQGGTYMLLAHQENGAYRIKWHVSNGRAPAAM